MQYIIALPIKLQLFKPQFSTLSDSQTGKGTVAILTSDLIISTHLDHIKTVITWAIMPYIAVGGYQCFRNLLHPASAAMANMYNTTRHNIRHGPAKECELQSKKHISKYNF